MYLFKAECSLVCVCAVNCECGCEGVKCMSVVVVIGTG